jgi:hypothetical protein
MRWHLSPTHGGQAYDIGSDDGANIALVYGPKDGGPADFLTNARKIAAAHEMHAAAKEMLAADDAMLAFILAARPATLGEEEWQRQHKARSERRLNAITALQAAVSKADGRS